MQLAILTFDSRETPKGRIEIWTLAAREFMLSQHSTCFIDLLKKSIGCFYVVVGDVKPNLDEIDLGLIGAMNFGH